MKALFSSRKSGAVEEPRRWQPLRVIGRGMCCAVGHDAPAASAAMAARLNHFRETEFVADGGHRVMGSALYDVPVWGAARRRLMLRTVIDEAMRNVGDEWTTTALVLLVPLQGSPGSPASDVEWLQQELMADSAGKQFHAASTALPYGKGGVAQALITCVELLQEERLDVTRVLLVGVDSLLESATIEALILHRRLATPSNADGVIPGEGAAAVLLSLHGSTDAPALWIEAAGHADEAWRLEGEIPIRAVGLTQAIREALSQTGLALADLDFHASGMAGESWYAKETSLALSRTLERRKPHFPHEMIARAVGETGAAAPVLTLAWLAEALVERPNPIGQIGLLHFACAEGRRSALVVRYRA